MIVDIAVLRFIWWVLLGVVLIAFAVSDGFDFGSAALMPFVTRNAKERRVIYNAIGPFWEGNQVWIILGGGALFAAWPFVYAVAFSGFYFLILLLLLTMGISRPVSIKYRGKIQNPLWQFCWDCVFFIGGICPALIFGLLMGNILLGAPFYFDQELRMYYVGSFLDLFKPFAWICALTSLFMLMTHGGLYLALKTHNPIRARALRAVRSSAILFIIFFALGGLFLTKVQGLQIVSHIDPGGYSNPLLKTVILKTGAWLDNYEKYPLLLLCPAFAFVGACLVILWTNRGKGRLAFLASGLCIASVLITVGVSLYPFLLPSSYHPTSSLLIWDASANDLTLLIMLVATIIFLPIILLYTTWVYRALRGKVARDIEDVDQKHTSYL